jgi:predicted nucleotidyltransferase
VTLPKAVDATLREVLASRADVRAAYLFGSQATGDARPDSDIDIGVLYRSPQPLRTTVAVEAALAEATGKHVNVVDVARAGAFLALDIVRGERIFTRDATDTDRFELYVLRRAGDLLPFERQRQALMLDPSR